MKRHTAGEDYLEAILILRDRINPVRSIDIARFLGFSKPSVSKAVSVLKKAGLLDMNETTFSLTLTEEGEKIASKIYERHCFFRDLLIYSGVNEEIANEDACVMEHAISSDSFSKLKSKLSPILNNN